MTPPSVKNHRTIAPFTPPIKAWSAHNQAVAIVTNDRQVFKGLLSASRVVLGSGGRLMSLRPVSGKGLVTGYAFDQAQLRIEKDTLWGLLWIGHWTSLYAAMKRF
jgi:hypothetical protein